MRLERLLAGERRAYLRRDRREWAGHLARIRAFFGEAFRSADPDRPVLVLGAGTGLELPWHLAPGSAVGWDADPWSRLGTALRHRRWPPWVFEDLTGGFRDLEAAIARALHRPGSSARRPRELAIRRLAGLVPSLHPTADPLRRWIAACGPGAILVANVMGQLGCMAERLVESAFRPLLPWADDPEGLDPLAEALDGWTVRTARAVCGALAESGAELWLVHDRAVIHAGGPVELGPLEDAWIRQLRSPVPLEVGDPLPGLDVREQFPGMRERAFDRWLWPVAQGQVHLMEALAFGCSAQSSGGGCHSV